MELLSTKIKVEYRGIRVGSTVELIEDSNDHECGKKGTQGEVIVKHVSVVPTKFFVRLHCGHKNCVCTVTRDQLRKASDLRGRN
jgi:hypothetical protein